MRAAHRRATSTLELSLLLLLVAGMCPAEDEPSKPTFTDKSGLLSTNPGRGFVVSVDLTVLDARLIVGKMTTKPVVIWVETDATTAKETSIQIPLDELKSLTEDVLSRARQAKSVGSICFARISFALARKNPYLKDALDLMKVKKGQPGFLDVYIDPEDATCLLVKSTDKIKFLKVE